MVDKGAKLFNFSKISNSPTAQVSQKSTCPEAVHAFTDHILRRSVKIFTEFDTRHFKIRYNYFSMCFTNLTSDVSNKFVSNHKLFNSFNDLDLHMTQYMSSMYQILHEMGSTFQIGT